MAQTPQPTLLNLSLESRFHRSIGTFHFVDYFLCYHALTHIFIFSNDMRGGDLVKIQATVTNRYTRDRVDFYYAADATNPQWVFITTAAPTAFYPLRDAEVLLPRTNPDITFTLPKCLDPAGCKQAIR
jgi:hypothetical protein